MIILIELRRLGMALLACACVALLILIAAGCRGLEVGMP